MADRTETLIKNLIEYGEFKEIGVRWPKEYFQIKRDVFDELCKAALRKKKIHDHIDKLRENL